MLTFFPQESEWDETNSYPTRNSGVTARNPAIQMNENQLKISHSDSVKTLSSNTTPRIA
jgi:hypothetical protein